MKYSSTFKWLIFLFLGGLLLSSCKKDKDYKKRAFKLRTDTWYRISPFHPFPLTINGISYVAFAHYPGGGNGNASHMGNCYTFFNQLAYGPSPQEPPAGSQGHFLIDVIHYPVTGAPLPMIQAGDFSALSSAVTALNIPSSLTIPTSTSLQIINQVIYNKKGDAIFTSAINGTGSTYPLSPTKVGFKGKALIISGRGKFSNAVGEIDYSGYFNVMDANDAQYNADGWIDY